MGATNELEVVDSSFKLTFQDSPNFNFICCNALSNLHRVVPYVYNHNNGALILHILQRILLFIPFLFIRKIHGSCMI